MEICGKGFWIQSEKESFIQVRLDIYSNRYNFLVFSNRNKVKGSPDFFVKNKNISTGEYQIIGKGWIVDTGRIRFVRISVSINGKLYPLLMFKKAEDLKTIPQGEHNYNVVLKRRVK